RPLVRVSGAGLSPCESVVSEGKDEGKQMQPESEFLALSMMSAKFFHVVVFIPTSLLFMAE
ncbi:Hypothetical predicted protein, partial [Lynx pardinus]